MYKTANTIRMLQILYSGGVVKKRDLAQELETNERNIREYKKELIMAGYDILEHKGRNGGLQLDSASIIPAARLNREQTDAFLEARDLVHTHSSFASMKEFDQAVEKLFSSVVPSPEEDDAILYLSRRRRDPRQTSTLHMEVCRRGIREKKRLKLLYRRRDGRMQEYLVEPYQVFYSQEAYYLFADKVEQGKTAGGNWRCFRFSPTRLQNVTLTEERFVPFTDVSLEQTLAEYGFVKTPNTKYQVRVRKEAEHLFRESDWGDDLRAVSQDEEWIRYTFHRDEKEGLFNQLLEFGPTVILESPADQQQEFKDRISALMEAYGS